MSQFQREHQSLNAFEWSVSVFHNEQLYFQGIDVRKTPFWFRFPSKCFWLVEKTDQGTNKGKTMDLVSLPTHRCAKPAKKRHDKTLSSMLQFPKYQSLHFPCPRLLIDHNCLTLRMSWMNINNMSEKSFWKSTQYLQMLLQFGCFSFEKTHLFTLISALHSQIISPSTDRWKKITTKTLIEITSL